MGGVIGRYLSHHMEFSDRKVVKERLLSFTTASTPHRGTPLANFLRRYSPGMFPDLEELDAKGLEKYNNPKYKETYSPEIEGIPNLSYVTYVNSVDDTNGSLGRVGYQYIVKKIQQDNRLNNQSRSIQNDGIVPRDSQAFGRVIWEREVNHSFFHMETEGSDQYSPMDFFEEHWEMLMDYEEPTIMSIMGLN